jgi:hypothetical protein
MRETMKGVSLIITFINWLVYQLAGSAIFEAWF